MTEAEWLACGEPETMLALLQDGLSERKLRLFACACCRRVSQILLDSRCLQSLIISERYADGLATDDELHRACVEVAQVAQMAQTNLRHAESGAAFALAYAADDAAEMGDHGAHTFDGEPIAVFARNAASSAAEVTGAPTEECSHQADLLRCIFGNPFRPVTFGPSWRTDTVATLARTMYESRDFSAMPILADALQDAGCDSEDVLNHCRSDGPHVRGCWVCDLVLDKE